MYLRWKYYTEVKRDRDFRQATDRISSGRISIDVGGVNIVNPI
jgi:hypothetical protein